MIPVGDYRYERIHPTGEPPCWVLFPNNAAAASQAGANAVPFEVCDRHRMEFIVETGMRQMDCPRCRFEQMEKEQVRKVRQMALDQQANVAANDTFSDRLSSDWKALCWIGLTMAALVLGGLFMRLDDGGRKEFNSWQGVPREREAAR